MNIRIFAIVTTVFWADLPRKRMTRMRTTRRGPLVNETK